MVTKTRDVLRHHRERVIANRLRQVAFTSSSPDCRPPGKFSKRSPFDCGQPHCWACKRPRYGVSERRQGQREEVID